MTEQASRILSERQAFEAMRRYLEGYWEEFRDARVSDVLSDTQAAFLADTVTADPAEWDRWTQIVDAVLATPE
jgi:hypothetical protein